MSSRTKVIGFACLVVFVFATGTAHAQRGFGGRSALLRVATVPEVGEELKFTDEQTELAKKLNEEQNEAARELFGSLRDLSNEERTEKLQAYREKMQQRETKLSESLGEEKFQRVQQLSFQSGGLVSVVFDRGTAEKLAITDEQRTQMREAFGGFGQELRDAGNDAEARAKVVQKMNEKVAELLSEEQKTKWKEMQGEAASDELLTKIRAATTRRRRN